MPSFLALVVRHGAGKCAIKALVTDTVELMRNEPGAVYSSKELQRICMDSNRRSRRGLPYDWPITIVTDEHGRPIRPEGIDLPTGEPFQHAGATFVRELERVLTSRLVSELTDGLEKLVFTRPSLRRNCARFVQVF